MASTFLSTLESAPHTFLQPTLPLHTDILAYLKNALDPIASEVSVTQQQRLNDARKKRKRGQHTPDEDVLQLKQVHVDGFGVEQVWEQARRVIDATWKEVELGFLEAEARQQIQPDASGSDEEDGSVLGEEGVDWEVDGEDVDEDVQYDGTSDAMDEDLDTDGETAQNALDEDMELDSEDGDDRPDEPAEELVTDKFGLNDGFFSIDNFNKQSEFLEQQDARGENDGAASDEEDVDWDADPYLAGAVDGEDGEMSGAAVGAAEDDDDDEEEAGGFGDPDAPSEDEEDELEAGEMDDMGGMGNTNNVMYKDFFAPPAQKKRPNKKGRPNPHNFPAKTAATSNGTGEVDEDAEETERNMAAVHRELFEDEESEEEEEGNELDPGDPKSRKSAHERRRAAIAEEIRKLEAANVAKRDWTLSGEARAADRPMNSLLEEDLDF
ncbi:U3 snoRNP protein, partial [Oleoguttula sp. CCFEE 5521]